MGGIYMGLSGPVILSIVFGIGVCTFVGWSLVRLTRLVKRLGIQVSALKEVTGQQIGESRTEITTQLEGKVGALRGDLTSLASLVAKGTETHAANVSREISPISTALGMIRTDVHCLHTIEKHVSEVRDLFRNDQSRGLFGEMQCKQILKEFLPNDIFQEKVKVIPGSNEVVDFAVKIPRTAGDPNLFFWLPIDSKFPLASFERLIDARKENDTKLIDKARKDFRTAIITQARSIGAKYVDTKHTAELAIMYLAAEAVFLEIVSEGLQVKLLQEYRVLAAGPTTLAGLVSVLRFGLINWMRAQTADRLRQSLDHSHRLAEKTTISLSEAMDTLSRLRNELPPKEPAPTEPLVGWPQRDAA